MKEACEGEVNQALWPQAGLSADLHAYNVSGSLKPTMCGWKKLAVPNFTCYSVLSRVYRNTCTSQLNQNTIKKLIYFGYSIKKVKHTGNTYRLITRRLMNVHFFENVMIMSYTIDTWKLHFLCLRKLDYNLRQKDNYSIATVLQ